MDRADRYSVDSSEGKDGEIKSLLKKKHGLKLPAMVQVSNHVAEIIAKSEGYASVSQQEWSKPKIKGYFHVVDARDESIIGTPLGNPVPSMDTSVASSVLKQFSSLTLEKVHHYAVNGQFLLSLFRDRKMVDLLIHIGGKLFSAHRCVMCAHSEYFTEILLNNSVPPNAITDVTIKSLDSELFRRFLVFCYTGDIQIERSELNDLRTLAAKLRSGTLRAKLSIFMATLELLPLHVALEVLRTYNVTDERAVAVEVVIKNFKEVLDSPIKMCRFAKEELMDIISADHLSVETELDVFWAVLFWVAYDWRRRRNDINELMGHVRFSTMTTWQLIDCARASELVRLSQKINKMLIQANWITLARERNLDDPLSLPQQSPRHCLLRQSPRKPTIEEFDNRYLIYTKLMLRGGGEVVFLGPADLKARDHGSQDYSAADSGQAGARNVQFNTEVKTKTFGPTDLGKDGDPQGDLGTESLKQSDYDTVPNNDQSETSDEKEKKGKSGDETKAMDEASEIGQQDAAQKTQDGDTGNEEINEGHVEKKVPRNAGKGKTVFPAASSSSDVAESDKEATGEEKPDEEGETKKEDEEGNALTNDNNNDEEKVEKKGDRQGSFEKPKKKKRKESLTSDEEKDMNKEGDRDASSKKRKKKKKKRDSITSDDGENDNNRKSDQGESSEELEKDKTTNRRGNNNSSFSSVEISSQKDVMTEGESADLISIDETCKLTMVESNPATRFQFDALAMWEDGPEETIRQQKLRLPNSTILQPITRIKRVLKKS